MKTLLWHLTLLILIPPVLVVAILAMGLLAVLGTDPPAVGERET